MSHRRVVGGKSWSVESVRLVMLDVFFFFFEGTRAVEDQRVLPLIFRAILRAAQQYGFPPLRLANLPYLLHPSQDQVMPSARAS